VSSEEPINYQSIIKTKNYNIAIALGQLSFIEFHKNKFKRLLWNDQLKVKHSYFYNIYEVKKNVIIINTENGPKLLNLVDNSVRSIKPPKSNTKVDWNKIEINFLLDYNEEKSIVATNDGFYFFDKAKEELSEFLLDSNEMDVILKGQVTSMSIDSEGFLWFGTWSTGAYKVDLKQKSLKHYNYDSKSRTLRRAMTRSIYVDKANNLWIGTRGGLGKYLPEQDSLHFYISKEEDLILYLSE